MPNHESPVSRTTLPLASTIDAPFVCSGPSTFDGLGVGRPESVPPSFAEPEDDPLLDPLDAPELEPDAPLDDPEPPLLDPLEGPAPLPLDEPEPEPLDP